MIGRFPLGEFMGGRVLKAVCGTVLLGSLLAGCTTDQDAPENVAPTPGAGQGQGAVHGQEEPEGNVITDEMILVVDDETDVRTDCENREVIVSADRATVILDGDCGLVRATGRGTVVEVGSAVKIILVGVDNEISFAGGDPEVINQGRNTLVHEGGQAQG